MNVNTNASVSNTAENLTTTEAAALLRLRPQTLALWRSAGRHDLRFTKIGSRVVYRRADLDAWLSARTATSTAAINAAIA